MTTAEAPTVGLTNADRCDRCGARAQTLVIMPSGGKLMFCQHHLNEHGSKLCELGATFISKREKED